MRAPVIAVAALVWLLLAVGLAPSSISYDGLAFVMRARTGAVDYGHALYVPLLGLAEALAGPDAEPGSGGKALAAVGSAAALVLLWLRLARGGTPFAHAGLLAALFAASTLLWHEAGALEPTTWTAAALLAAGEASAAYGRRPGWGRLALALGALLLALGFHVVSLLAVPWLVALARRGRPPRKHVALVAAAAIALVALALAGGELGAFLAYWSGFLPRFEDGIARELGGHVLRGGRLLAEGAPVLLLLALGLELGRRLRRTDAAADGRGAQQAALALAWPYGLAFVALGKPLVALLVPVVLAAALSAGDAAARATAAGRRPSVVLALALAVQLALAAPQALAWRLAPDVPRARAALIARYLPEGRRLLAGPLANHLRLFHPGLDVVDVTALVHAARVRDRGADAVEVVRAFVAGSERPCVLSSDAAAWLAGLDADAEQRLDLRLGDAFLVPEDPRLVLFPL